MSKSNFIARVLLTVLMVMETLHKINTPACISSKRFIKNQQLRIAKLETKNLVLFQQLKVSCIVYDYSNLLPTEFMFFLFFFNLKFLSWDLLEIVIVNSFELLRTLLSLLLQYQVEFATLKNFVKVELTFVKVSAIVTIFVYKSQTLIFVKVLNFVLWFGFQSLDFLQSKIFGIIFSDCWSKFQIFSELFLPYFTCHSCQNVY